MMCLTNNDFSNVLRNTSCLLARTDIKRANTNAQAILTQPSRQTGGSLSRMLQGREVVFCDDFGRCALGGVPVTVDDDRQLRR